MGKVIGGLIVVALVAMVGMRIVESKKKQSAPVEKPVESTLIRSAKAEKRGMNERIAFTGSILAHNEVDVFAKLPGRIETLAVKVGDKVHAGQMLAQVEHRELGWQGRSAAAALQAAQAGVKVAQANVDGVKLEFDRTKALFDGGSATQAQLDGAKIHLDAANAQFAAAQAQAAQAEAGKGLVEQQLVNSRIDSPIEGTVTRKNVNVGINTGPQSPAFTIQDVATLKLESSVQADEFARLAKGMPVAIRVDSYPGEIFSGKVDVLAPTLDPQTRRAAVEIAIDNHDGRLLPHMFARAAVTVGHLASATVVPKDAVLESPGGSVVYRVKAGHVEALRPKLGAEDEGFIPVLDGLSAGDEVAVGGLGSLSDGAAVRVSAAAISRKD